MSLALRHRAATLALAATIGLTAFKLAVAFVSGSVGMLSEGIHSFLDVVSASMAFYTVREAGKPADHDHPFGHGKIETLSSLFESLLLVVAAGMIIWEGVEHLQNPRPVTHEVLAMATIAVSMIVSYAVYRHQSAAGAVTESSAIRVNALHFLADVVASLGVLIGLGLLKLTGWQVIDPIMAFAVAAYIMAVSAKQVRGALQELSDTTLPAGEIAAIRAVIDEFKNEMIEAHDLRTRKSGAIRHIDFHLVVWGTMTVKDSHSLCDRIEDRLAEKIANASVTIHVEPQGHEHGHVQGSDKR